jgi:hypothetical protein
MRPMYYFPGLQKANEPELRQKIQEAQLGPVLGDIVSALMPNYLERGPDKGHGLLVAHAPPLSNGSSAQYKPEIQTWVEIKPRGYWFGWITAKPPEEPDLRRDVVYEDYRIKLADGHEWSIMAVTPYQRFGEIPRVCLLGDDFEWRWKPDDRFKDLVEKFTKTWESPPQTHDEYAELCVTALQVNYRVDKYLLMCCQLLPANACYRIVEAALDEPAVQKWLEAKKKEEQPSGDSSTTAGGLIPEASPDLAQPLPI